MNPELFNCANCERCLALDIHGRCSHCGSDAVSSAEIQPKRKIKRMMTKKQKAVKELERMHGLTKPANDPKTVTDIAREFVDKTFPLRKP